MAERSGYGTVAGHAISNGTPINVDGSGPPSLGVERERVETTI